MDTKLFGKYSLDGLLIKDKSIAQVINLRPIYVPHSFGRNAAKSMGKTNVNVVERLANKLMRGGTGEKTSGKVIRTHGRLQGKKLKALNFVEDAMEMVEKETKENPVQVLIRAIEFAAPREDVTRVSHGGVSYQVAVDVSATRRLDLALRNISLAALMGAFNKAKPLSRALADEIISTGKGDLQTSYAMKKRDETERMARSAR